MWGSFLPKIIVPVAMSLLGKKFKQDAPKGGFMEGFGTSIAGLYTGKDGEIPTAKFEHLGSGGGSLIEAKIDALTSNLKLSNFKENFYGNSALTYLSQVLNAQELRKSNIQGAMGSSLIGSALQDLAYAHSKKDNQNLNSLMKDNIWAKTMGHLFQSDLKEDVQVVDHTKKENQQPGEK